MAFRSRRGKLKIVCVSFVHDCDFGQLELVSLVFGLVEEIKQKIEDTVEKNGREDASLEEADVKIEKTCGPFLSGHLGTDFLIIVED